MTKKCSYSDCITGELEEKKYRKPFQCDGCKMKGIGQGCRCKDCDFVLHMECMYPSEKLRTPLLPSHVLKFTASPNDNTYCDACGKLIKGFLYHSSRPEADLHPCCAKLETSFTIREQGMNFILKKDTAKIPHKCKWCQSRKVKGGHRDVRGWFYESTDKKFNFHVFCIMDMAIRSCESTAKRARGDFELGLELELASLPSSSNARSSKKRPRDMGVEVTKLVLSKVLSMVLGDPTGTLGQLVVEGGMRLVQLIYYLLRD